jgi:hypothetical protein
MPNTIALKLTDKQLASKVMVRVIDQLLHQGVAVQIVKKKAKKVRYN